jgi:23S rRNA (uracil1939-C5)-methyltransferase
VTFVPLSAPGDRVLVRTVEAHRRYLHASLVEVVAPGPCRVEPVCPVFGCCGGCAWQHIRYRDQLEAKRSILEDALTRIAKLEEVPQRIEMRASPAVYGYRSRARVLVDTEGVGFRRRRSREVCATDRCPILVPRLEAALAALARGARVPRGEWELAAGDAGEISILAPDGRQLEEERTWIRSGPDRIGISAGAFAQANAALRTELAEAVHEAAGAGEILLELFAGSGFLTLGLARRFRRVIALESNPRAVRDLARNLRDADLTNVELHAAPVEHALRRAPLAALRPDVVLVDPPRSGLPRRITEEIDAARLVYLSCDPATLARDLSALAEGGFRLVRVTGFDLFPQTAHVEALAVLERE